jgi:predicted RNA-binding protein (virulence factor B family)
MYKLGKYNKLKISKEVDFGVYLTDDDENEILLPGKQVPSGTKLDDIIEVFVYNDSEDRTIATINKPKGTVGDIVSLQVVEVGSLGAFLDWGLEKDLLLPFKHQKRHKRLSAYDKILVKIMHDEVSDRLIASTRIMSVYEPSEGYLKNGDAITIQIAEEHDLGYVVVINNKYQGMLFSTDIFEKFLMGDTTKGYIKNIREDGKIDVSLKPVGVKAIHNDKELVMEKLREADGFLPFNSSSSPEEIKKWFNLSKKAFKKAIGGLYKEKIITITDAGIELT